MLEDKQWRVDFKELSTPDKIDYTPIQKYTIVCDFPFELYDNMSKKEKKIAFDRWWAYTGRKIKKEFLK